MLKDRLREARKKAGKTQQEVAAAIGITESTYCGYETGKRQPDALKIRAIASFLDTSGDFLLDIETEENAPSGMDEALIHLFHQLNEEGQEKLLDYADDLVQSEKYIKNNEGQLASEA